MTKRIVSVGQGWNVAHGFEVGSVSNHRNFEAQTEAIRTMKTALINLSIVIAFAIIASFPSAALAVEGGLGRPVSGMQITPYAGLVPPEPGLALSVGETYYQGSIGGNLDVPIAGLLAANLDTKVAFTPIALLYIWPTPTKSWNFASVAAFPMAWIEVEANLSLGPRSVRTKQSMFGLFDLAFTPIIASHHFSETDHLAFDFTFWAPTGEFKKGRLVNLSLNNWTFIPGIAYTKLFPKANVELSGIWDMEFYTENPETNFQNGIVSDLEALAIKRFKNGFGIGVVGSWIQQVTDDQSALTPDGFVGRALGIGPIVTYSTKIGKSHLDFNARWVPEFDVSKRIGGDGFNLTASLKF